MNCDELSVIDCSKERQYDKKIVSKKNLFKANRHCLNGCVTSGWKKS